MQADYHHHQAVDVARRFLELLDVTLVLVVVGLTPRTNISSESTAILRTHCVQSGSIRNSAVPPVREDLR